MAFVPHLSICTCTSSSMYIGRDLRGMGLRPLPRIPTFFIQLTFLPIPLHGLLLRSYGGGWGGKDDPFDWEVKGLAVPCPFPKKHCDDGKGAMVSWTMRPILFCSLTQQHDACKQQQGAAKPRRRSRPKKRNPKEKAEPKGKGQEGFLGCGCQVGIPT